MRSDAEAEPSRTALTAAAARAAHLLVDQEPFVFHDDLAAVLLGSRADELLAYHHANGSHPVLAGARATVVTRSRYTEDRLAAAVADGIDQYVILGAGLDSYAYRHQDTPGIAVFEVDHPATQRWKRAEAHSAGLPEPSCLTYVPVDLETEPFMERLADAGFDLSRPAFVSWLGVTMYLTRDAIDVTLASLARLAPGSVIVLDHLLPEEERDEAAETYASAVKAFSAEHGEPWLSAFGPADMAALLRSHRFEVQEQRHQREAVGGELWHRYDALRPTRFSMLTSASV